MVARLGRRTSSTSNPRPEAGSSTERRGAGLVFTRMHGHASGEMVVAMHADISKLLGTQSRGAWLVDTRTVSGFDAMTLPAPAAALLRDLKARDIAVIAIVTLSPVRMMGATLCLAAGVRHRFFESYEEGERYAQSLADEDFER